MHTEPHESKVQPLRVSAAAGRGPRPESSRAAPHPPLASPCQWCKRSNWVFPGGWVGPFVVLCVYALPRDWSLETQLQRTNRPLPPTRSSPGDRPSFDPRGRPTRASKSTPRSVRGLNSTFVHHAPTAERFRRPLPFVVQTATNPSPSCRQPDYSGRPNTLTRSPAKT